MTIEKLHDGAYRISEIVNNYLVTQVYYYYTKKEAMANFKAYLNTMI